MLFPCRLQISFPASRGVVVPRHSFQFCRILPSSKRSAAGARSRAVRHERSEGVVRVTQPASSHEVHLLGMRCRGVWRGRRSTNFRAGKMDIQSLVFCPSHLYHNSHQLHKRGKLTRTLHARSRPRPAERVNTFDSRPIPVVNQGEWKCMRATWVLPHSDIRQKS